MHPSRPLPRAGRSRTVALTGRILPALLLLSACSSDDPARPSPPGSVDDTGGTLEFDGGMVRLHVPPGAVGDPVTPEVTRVGDPAPDTGLVGAEYRFGPAGTSFGDSAEVRLAVDPSLLVDLAAPQDVIGGVRVNGEWQGVPGSWFDPETSEVVIPVWGFDAPDSAEVVDVGDEEALGRRRTGRAVAVWGSGAGRGLQFGALRPLYVTPVGGSDVPTCGTLAQPCFTMRYAMARMRYGEKVVLLGPGTFGDDRSLLDLPPNARLEGQGGAVIEDVGLRIGSAPNQAAVLGVTIENSTPGTAPAIVVEDGRPVFESVTSRSSSGVRIAGGEVTLRNLSLRDDAAFIDVTGGTRHLFVGCTLRNGGAAVIFQRSTGGTMRGCTLRSNQTGVFVPYHGNVTLVGNTFRGNGIGVMMGHDPNPVLDVPTCSGILQGNTFRGQTGAGLRMATTGTVRRSGNEWETTPPTLWNGPAPWFGAPDIVDLLAPLGEARWWELPASGPSPRLGAAMAWEHDLQQVILFGGLGARGDVLDDTWSFDPGQNSWQRLNSVVPPSARTEHAMAGGGASGRCFLFGGRDNASPFNVFGDFYVFDPVAEEWLALDPAPHQDGRRPGPRYGASFVALNSDLYVLYGGLGPGNGSYAEWWIYDAAANAWTDPTDHANLPPFRGFAATGVGPSNRVWTYGGQDAFGNPLEGIHRFAWGNGNLNEWAGYTTFGIPALTHASLQRVDVGLGVSHLVLFGGITGGRDPDVTDRTWVLETGGPSGTPTLTSVDHLLDVRPGARARHASVSYPAAHGTACLIFGGGGGGNTLFSDTWIYARGGGN